MWRGAADGKLLIHSALVPCHFLPLKPKYLPQLLIFEHPQPVLFCQCERQIVTSVQHSGQNETRNYLYGFSCPKAGRNNSQQRSTASGCAVLRWQPTEELRQKKNYQVFPHVRVFIFCSAPPLTLNQCAG